MALTLRRKGLSYNEIKKKIDVSKDTLSRWCRNIILNTKQLERLQGRKLKGAERGRVLGAKRQQRDRIKRSVEIFKRSKGEIGRLNKRDRFIAGIALYLGDGLKGDSEVGISNSDPAIIKFMMGWFREFCQAPEGKFHGQIWIHDNRDERKARNYWSKVTSVPLTQFRKSYIAQMLNRIVEL